jgi:hypothetical protein
MPTTIAIHSMTALVRNEVQFLGPLGVELPRWKELARKIISDFGLAPAGFGEVYALLSLSFGERHWAVVQVESCGEGALCFRFLILSNSDWLKGVDPFALNEAYPPNWDSRGQTESLQHELTFNPPTVDQAAIWLKEHDRATLLGGLQAVLDGARLWHEGTKSNVAYGRAMWNLLPYRSRFDFSFSTFAFQPIPELKYEVLHKEALPANLPMGVLSLQQTGDYPLGRYEQALQLAIEERNAGEFEMLLRRRTSRDTLHLAVGLMIAMMVVLIVVRLMK